MAGARGGPAGSPPPKGQGDDPPGLSKVVQEAMDRFDRCVTWEKVARARFLDDFKFANADAYNGYQWPNDLRRTREVDDRPCLTLNGTRQHNLQVINDAKQNKPGIKIMPVADGADVQSAQAYTALVKHIEYRSNATTAYDHATFMQVTAGWGYVRVGHDYTDEDNFNQEIRIARVWDPLNVYMDCDAREPDRSDAKYAFFFEDIERSEMRKDPKWGRYADVADSGPLGEHTGWFNGDYVRVAEYFRVVEKEDKLYALPAGYVQGFQGGFIKRSTLQGAKKGVYSAILKQLENDPKVRSREMVTRQVERHLIIGHQEIEEEFENWPGKYIPCVPVWGEEYIIEGTWDCKSHTRCMIDPQRMYNYAASSAVEYMAVQSKSPYLAPVEAIEELETYWNNANRINTSVLPYKALREDGSVIPPPQRLTPPSSAPAYGDQMRASLQDLLMVSGQYAAQMGAQGNERSAKAIGERQRQADNATYHFVDNLAIAIRHLGRIVLDLIPHIYDTKRVLQVLAEDGQTIEMQIDPQAKQAYQRLQQQNQQTATHILNPGVGRYEVQADVGPNYATRREETAEAMKLILTQNPQMASLLGDIFLRALDFEHADEAAQRLRRLVPPHALGEGPSAQEQALTTQVQNLQNLLQKAMEELTIEKIKLRGREEKNEIGIFSAWTDRLKVLVEAAKNGEADLTPDKLEPIVKEMVQDMLAQTMSGASDATQEELGNLLSGTQGGLPLSATKQQPPVAGAKQDYSGQWYARDFSKSKDYRRVS